MAYSRLIAMLLLGLTLISLGCQPPPAQNQANPSVPPVYEDPSWLVKLVETGRITGDNPCPTATDRNGNTYIGSFQPHPDANDSQPLLIKVSAGGKEEWRLELNTVGRIMGVVVQGEEIWIGGYYTGALQMDRQKVSTPEYAAFIGKVNTDGKCTQLMSSEGKGVVTGLTRDDRGMLWVKGRYEWPFKIGGATFSKPWAPNPGFFARLHPDGTARWIQSTRGTVDRLLPAPGGGAFFCGAYRDTMEIYGHKLASSGPFDSNGYIGKMDSTGRLAFLFNLGRPGIFQRGYRTREGVYDIAPGPQGGVMTSTILDDEDRKTDFLQVSLFSARGSLVRKKTIAYSLARPMMNTLTRDSKGDYWLSFNARDSLVGDSTQYFPGKTRTFLYRFNDQLEVLEVNYSENCPNCGIQKSVGNPYGPSVMFSGTFQEHFRWGDYLASGRPGKHTLFLLKISE